MHNANIIHTQTLNGFDSEYLLYYIYTLYILIYFSSYNSFISYAFGCELDIKMSVCIIRYKTAILPYYAFNNAMLLNFLSLLV